MYGTISQLLDKTTAENPDAIVQLGKNRAGSFIPRSYSLLQRESRGLALALRRLGVRRGDAVGIISDNRSEWFVADLAILSLGAADVPRGRDAMPYEIEYMFSVTGLSIAFAENDAQLEKMLALRPSLPALRTIILIEGENRSDSGDVEVRLYSDLLEEGLSLLDAEGGKEEIEREIALGNEEDTATIIFTSGTTGLPKGVMLSHRNIIYQLHAVDKIIVFEKGWTALSVLPIWHAFERIIQYVVLFKCCTVAYSKPIGKVMLTDFQRVNPEVFCSVPRIWETVKAGVYQNLKNKKPIERKVFSFFLAAAKLRRHFENLAYDLYPRLGKPNRIRMKAAMIPYAFFSLIYRLGDKLAFSQIKEKLGSSFVAGISGGGSMSRDVEEFFSAIGIKLLDGYGLTETAPVIGLQRYPRSIVGYMQPFEGTEIKVVDPETGRELPKGEKGELLVRGPQVMKGYYNDEERTRRVIDRDGFFHTGDLAIIEARGDFAIVGRVKDTIVLSGGENIEPVPIENALIASEYIESAVVVGQDRRYLGALIVIDSKNVERFLKDSNVPYFNKTDLTDMDEVRHLIDGEVQRLVSRANGFKPYEQVSRFVLLSRPFQVGRELSAKQEVKRAEIQKLYKDEIESIFI